MKPKILLIDDEADTRSTLKDILESEGYEVDLASGGAEGLRRLARSRPDLILLDIMMPGEDGIDIARVLSDGPDTGEIPIIIITALHEFSTGSGLGGIPAIRRFIYKPCSTRVLLEGIEDVLHCPR